MILRAPLKIDVKKKSERKKSIKQKRVLFSIRSDARI